MPSQDANAGADVRHLPQSESLQFNEDQGGNNLDGQFSMTSHEESAVWFMENKICDIETHEPGQDCEGNISHKYLEPETETRKSDSNKLQVEEVPDVHALRGECSKLSQELTVVTFSSHREVGCRVDTLQIHEERQFCLDEVSQRINVLQGNGK